MTGAEAGFLLLSCHLGNPDRNVLTTAQIRTLFRRMRNSVPEDPERELMPEDLVSLGYGRDMASRIVALLSEEDLLQHCLRRAKKAGCVPIPRNSPSYPDALRERLGDEAPGCLWAKGDLSILDRPGIALVGSRELNPKNAEFAREAGRQAARQGFVLISGNARGADKTAQDACLQAGGKVISIVADSLQKHAAKENMLYLSEEDFDAEFSAQRALSRNRCIHALGEKVLVAQSNYQQGGTWDGTVKNLRFGWSPVFCFDDKSPAVKLLAQMGAKTVTMDDLTNLAALQADEEYFLTR